MTIILQVLRGVGFASDNIRLHGMLFTKVGLEFFAQILEIFIDKLSRLKDI